MPWYSRDRLPESRKGRKWAMKDPVGDEESPLTVIREGASLPRLGSVELA